MMCVMCCADFAPRNRLAKYCSSCVKIADRQRKASYKQRQRAKKVWPTQCIICGEQLEPPYGAHRRYCAKCKGFGKGKDRLDKWRANPDYHVAYVVCCDCGERVDRRYGKQVRCPRCDRRHRLALKSASERRLYRVDLEKSRRNSRHAANRRRALKINAPGSHTADEFVDVLSTFSNRCAYCGGPFADGQVTIDHMVPLSRGGSDNITNIWPACRSCNCSKSDKTTGEYLAWRLANLPDDEDGELFVVIPEEVLVALLRNRGYVMQYKLAPWEDDSLRVVTFQRQKRRPVETFLRLMDAKSGERTD